MMPVLRPRVERYDWYEDALASNVGDRVPTGRMLPGPKDRSPSMGNLPTPGAGDFDPRYKPTKRREKEFSYTKATIVVIAGLIVFTLLVALKK